MRYFGKDGPQSQPTQYDPSRDGTRTRHLGRAVLHGRVSRMVCLWLGLALFSAAVGAGLAALMSLGESGRAVRDPAAAMVIRR